MAIAKKEFLNFLIATIFSVLGGIFGYLIGAYFFDLAMNIVEFYNYENKLVDIKMLCLKVMVLCLDYNFISCRFYTFAI